MLNRFKAIVFLVGISVFQQSFAMLSDPTQPSDIGLNNASSQATATGPKLNAVFISKERRVAIINNQLYKEGDTFSGMRIMAILPYAVQLRTTSNEQKMLPLNEIVKQGVDISNK